MKKKIFLFVFLFSFCFFFVSNSFADNSASAVYQLFVNDLAKNHGTEYSNYQSNKNAIIFDCREFRNFDYYFAPDYLGIYNSVANRNRANNNQPTVDYVFINYPAPVVHRMQNASKTINRTTIYSTENLYSNHDFNSIILVSAIYSDGSVSINNFRPNQNFPFYYNPGINLIWSDKTITEQNSQQIYFPASSDFLNPSNFTYNGDETPNTTYQKIMAWINANQNFYGNLWAEGPKPTIAIFKNNNNIVANLIDNNNIIANEYIAVMSSDRLCEYDLNNNSEHYNLFSYNVNKIYYFLFSTGTNNCNFYYMGAKNSQADVLTVTNLNSNALFYCNSNIIKKSDANNFVINSDNSHALFYSSPLEDAPLYPFNNNGNTTSSGISSSIWTEDDIDNLNSKIDNNSSFLGSILSKLTEWWDSLWNVASDFIANAVTSLIATIRQVIGINFIVDMLNYIQELKTQAIEYKNNILANNGVDLSFIFMNKTITFNPFSFFFEHLYAFFYRISNLIFVFFMSLFFYKKTYKILNKNSDSE